MDTGDSTHLGRQIVELLILGIPVACIARTVIFEELFKEPRDWFKERCETCRTLLQRKFFYLFTCEYCFSHYLAAIFIAIARYKLLFDDWRGYLISFFSLVFVANVYLNLYGRIRIEMHKDKAVIKSMESSGAAGKAAAPLDSKIDA